MGGFKTAKNSQGSRHNRTHILKDKKMPRLKRGIANY
jgi:hypothetical protein